jgi:hypothetical protein
MSSVCFYYLCPHDSQIDLCVGFLASRFSPGQASPYDGVVLQINDGFALHPDSYLDRAVRHPRLRNYKVGRPGREGKGAIVEKN